MQHWPLHKSVRTPPQQKMTKPSALSCAGSSTVWKSTTSSAFHNLTDRNIPWAPVPPPQWLAPSSLWVLSLTKLLPYLSCKEEQGLADLVLVNFPFPHLFHAMGCCGIHSESQWLTGGDPDGDHLHNSPQSTQNKVDCHRYSQPSIFWSHSFYPDLYISPPQMQALPQLGLLWISSLP